MTPLKILLTNFDLSLRGGTQLYVRDVALGLLRRGHVPFAYSPVLGSVAAELKRATIPVLDDLDGLDVTPDVIHGNHNHELMTALLRFQRTPAIRVCHGWADEPPHQFPRIMRYLAVDRTTADRCLFEWGLPARRFEVLLNFVDLARFQQRPPLPARPARALVFSNNADVHLWAVRRACATHDVSVDAVGEGVGGAALNPEQILGRYDLVFAKARAAMEALATGCAVVLCDATGVGPMVTTANLDELRPLNFGVRTLRTPVSPREISEQIARFDANDAREVSRRIRDVAGLDHVLDRLIELYHEVIADYGALPEGDVSAEFRAASSYLKAIAPRLRWSDAPHAGLYVLARSLYHRARRVPGLRSLMHSAAGQRLVSSARQRWRRRFETY